MSERKVVMNLHALLLEVHYAQNVSLFGNVHWLCLEAQK